MKTWLYNYDVYPRIVEVDTPVSINILPLGRHAAFDASLSYHVEILPLLHRKMVVAKEDTVLQSVPAIYENGSLFFEYTFSGEQEHFLFLYCLDDLVEKFSVYSLNSDLACRIPLLGDLHVHSTFSDGKQAPEVVAADYRKRGYDFMTLTDHHNYAGSLAAIKAYDDVPIDLNIVPGEEVHLPGNDVHIVNFGSKYSVNFLLESSVHYAKISGIDPELDNDCVWKCLPGITAPTPISDECYYAEVKALIGKTHLPADTDYFSFCSCLWICDQIHKAGGLAIFAHPYWINYAYHIPEKMTDLLFERCPFDCFEVLGGERYLEQNEFQIWHYVKELAGGHGMPVVGSSDSHGVYNNVNGADAATIVFAKANERTELISSIRDGWSVAVDLISSEKRLVGDLRLIRYARFLLEYYFPISQELCFEEGRLMKAYVCGTDPLASRKLTELHGQTALLRSHLFTGR